MSTFTPLAGRASMLLVLLAFPSLIAQAQERRPRFINPPGLTKPNGYTHVVVTSDGRTAHIAGQVALDSAGRVVGAGDFNKDGRTDLVWHNQATGYLSIWLMDGVRLSNGVWVTPDRVTDTNWKIRGVADVNGDGMPDLIWQHAANGATVAAVRIPTRGMAAA